MSKVCQWRDNYPKALAFTWDDNVPWHYEVAEVFDKYHLKTTFFINTGLFYNWKSVVLNPTNYFKYRAILKHGHEVGTHTSSNINLMSVDYKRAEWEVNTASEQLHDLFGYWPTAMSHPTSHYDTVVDSLCHLTYLDTRYSIRKDSDSSYVFMYIRTKYPFLHYKKDLDRFVGSRAASYVYGGHSLDGKGFEPIARGTMDSLLTYMQAKYSEDLWISTFENMAMYEYLRDNVSLTETPGEVVLNTDIVKGKMEHFSHPDCIVTLCFPNENLDFVSDGLVNSWYEDGSSYASVDLRKSNILHYGRAK